MRSALRADDLRGLSRTPFEQGTRLSVHQTGQQLLLGAYQQLSRQIGLGGVRLFNRVELVDTVVIEPNVPTLDIDGGGALSFAIQPLEVREYRVGMIDEPVLIGSIRADGPFDIISQTELVEPDSYSKYLHGPEEIKKLTGQK